MADNQLPLQIDRMALHLPEGNGGVVVYEAFGSQGRSIFAWPCRDKGRRHDLDAPVVRRTIDGQLVYAAVFPMVPAGNYHLLSPWGGHASRITVSSGTVTQVDWREPSSAPGELPPECPPIETSPVPSDQTSISDEQGK